MQIFLFRSSLMQLPVRVLERVYFIHAAHTVHSIRAVIKFYFRQLCVYAFHGSLWKYVGNSCNNTQTHANAPLYSPSPLLPSSHSPNASQQRCTLLALFPYFETCEKENLRDLSIYVYDRSISIPFYPSLLFHGNIRSHGNDNISSTRKNTWIVNELGRASRGFGIVKFILGY